MPQAPNRTRTSRHARGIALASPYGMVGAVARRWWRVSRAVAALALFAPVVADAGPATAVPSKLLGLTVAGGATPTVTVRLSGRITPVVKELPAAGDVPPRVYLDLPGTTLVPSVPRTFAGRGVVTAVRTGQFDASTARIVVDLGGTARFTLAPRGTTLALRFETTPATPGAAAAGTPPAPAPPPPAEPRELARPEGPTPPRVAAIDRAVAAAPGDVDVVLAYAVDPAAVKTEASPATRATVADALRNLGLIDAAAGVLGDARADEEPALRLARAELALAGGNPASARATLGPLDRSRLAPALAERLGHVEATVALAEGRTPDAKAGGDVELARTAARATLAAGQAAARTRSWPLAAASYQQVLAAPVDGALHGAAATGLARAAWAAGDEQTATTALHAMATDGDPLLRRAAATLARARGMTLEAPERRMPLAPAEEPWP